MKSISTQVRRLIRKKGYDIVRHKRLPELLELNRVDVVLDIGANDGRYATEIREASWSGPIVSFEPQPETFERLSQRMSGDTNWTGHRMGLGSEDSTLPMNAYGMDVLSSFLEKKQNDQQVNKIEVEVKRLDTIFDKIMDGHRRPFLKIDTQGFELEIIRGLGDRVGDVVGWQLELSVEPLYENQPLIEDVIAKMRSLGFSLWQILPGLRDPKTLQSFELDGIFFRST